MPCDVAVIIPATTADELISACLWSALTAIDVCEREGYVVVAVDSGGDLTAARARTVLGARGFVLEGAFGNSGAARHAATAFAMDKFCPRWLANTEADTRVAPDWLRHQFIHERQGYEVVAGTVTVDDFGGRPPDLEARFKTFYGWHNADHEPHIHGANLSFGARIYQRSPGWETVESGEGRRLWAAFGHAGAARLACPQLVVDSRGRAA